MELDKTIYSNNTKLEAENAKLKEAIGKFRESDERTKTILKKVLNNASEVRGDKDVICELFSIGCTSEEISNFGFDKDDIDGVKAVMMMEQQEFEIEPEMVQTSLFL